MRKYPLNRWNWSERAKKWVYVTKEGGKRKYKYQLDPPEVFIELTEELEKINKKLMKAKDFEENKKLFEQLMKISKKMQAMGYDQNSIEAF